MGNFFKNYNTLFIYAYDLHEATTNTYIYIIDIRLVIAYK